MKRVAVIGAGVVGALVSRELTKYNFKVTVLERMSDVAMGATRANSAIVHAGFDAKEGSLKAKLNVEGSEMMEQVAAELGVKYNRCGSLVVGFNDEDRKTLEELLERGRKNGVRELRIAEREELISLEKLPPNFLATCITEFAWLHFVSQYLPQSCFCYNEFCILW